MKRSDIIERLSSLPFQKSDYWVVTGATMVLHGLKEEARDIDLGCSSSLADELCRMGYKTVLLRDGTRMIRISEDIEAFEGWLFGEVEYISGFPVISLEGLLEMKKALAREKDIADIRLIENKLGKKEQK